MVIILVVTMKMTMVVKMIVMMMIVAGWVGWARFNVPTNTLQVVSETGFYQSNDKTNSVKALKEDRVLRIRLQSNQVHPTVLQ